MKFLLSNVPSFNCILPFLSHIFKYSFKTQKKKSIAHIYNKWNSESTLKWGFQRAMTYACVNAYCNIRNSLLSSYSKCFYAFNYISMRRKYIRTHIYIYIYDRRRDELKGPSCTNIYDFVCFFFFFFFFFFIYLHECWNIL